MAAVVGLVGRSAVHRTLMARLIKFAATDAEILITGPTGVGKELYAQYGQPVQLEDLPLLSDQEHEIPLGELGVSFQNAKQELVSLFEREFLEQALRRSHGNIAEAARASGKARRAFFELMRKHGVRAVHQAHSA
ncbi:MAG TPA: helix-turn-helix domain-containing protein [Verrucomicrobiae bacterium]|nr:helix-turn-helix domain-containing protein [Verrucomicrobiae bacterium]